MTEKRFYLVSLEYDGEQRFVRDNCLIGEKSMSNKEVVDALNDFSEEIERLKTANKNLTESRRELIETMIYRDKVIGGLTEENEQLKELLGAVREELELADRENTILEQENEKLKKLVWIRVMK